jgi:thiosulfate reductase cytochrome b subunit
MAPQNAQRHSATTRITHWGILASFALLFGTGAAIYDRRPRFRLGSQSLTLPRIPSWLTVTFSPTIVHYIFAGVFVLCGIAYFAWGLRNGHFKELLLKRDDAAKLVPMQLYYLRLRNEPPQYGRYNPLQKLAYSIVLFVIAPLIVLSGAALLPFPIFHPIETIFVGGVKLWHFALMLALCLFIIIHVGMVLATGLVKNMRPMI